MSTKALIEATALNRFYGDYQAVNDFNLTLHQGEVLGLLGPNGAGKSTTMQMLTGNISPTSGEIKIHGVDLLEYPLKAKQSIGYLPEQPPVYRDMTPREFLSYCAVLHDIPKANVKAAVERSVERCGLGAVIDKLIANLSKGYQQRVGIAQAILHQPQVVILDEPTVGLDPIQITQIRELIRELGNDHSVILSTHILPEVQAVCDRVQIINQGKTVFSDSFSELSERQSSKMLTVGFDKGGDTESLKLLQNIDKVEVLENNRYQLSYIEEPNGNDVFKLAIEKGWELNEISAQTESLEQIFMNLIHSDATTATSDLNTNNSPQEEKIVKTRGGV